MSLCPEHPRCGCLKQRENLCSNCKFKIGHCGRGDEGDERDSATIDMHGYLTPTTGNRNNASGPNVACRCPAGFGTGEKHFGGGQHGDDRSTDRQSLDIR
jgi:hypothetical protein